MGHIFCLMGKSSSGKDTIYSQLLKDRSLGLDHIVTGTTRPIRAGEQNGREYYFYSTQEMDALIPIYLEVDDGLRLQRALDREREQKEPKYAELCRRFLADEEDFSTEKLREAGICRIFQNTNLDQTVDEIKAYIKGIG